MSFNPGGGGGIASASDVALSNPQNTHTLVYDSSVGKWKNNTLTSTDIADLSAVAISGDYSDVNGTPAAAIPLSAQATWPLVPAQTTATVDYNTGTSSYPSRPTNRTDIIVRWRGPVPPSVGSNGAVDNVDEWINTP